MSTLQKAVGVADQSCCQGTFSDAVTHSSSMPVSLLSHQDSTVCDSGSESMGFSDTDNEGGSSIKETLLNIKVLNGEADRKVKSNGEDEAYGVNLTQTTDKVTDSSTVVLLSEDEDHHNEDHPNEEKSEEEEMLRNKLEEDKLLTDGKEELSSETPVNEDEEFRLLMEVDEEETQHKIVSRKNAKAVAADPENEDKTLPDRVNSPVSDNGSSQSSCKMEQDGCSKFSDSESVSSNTSENKKHPLFIGKNMKYSFKGMMKTAVERVSHDSDSVKSFSPSRDEDSKPCSPKPDSCVTSAGSNSLTEETDLPADSSTMPDDRNLFEKLSLLTDSGKEDTDIDKDQGSNSEISTSKGNAGTVADSRSTEDCSEKTDTPVCSPEEPMETDSAKVTIEDSNSRHSVVSTTSVDNKEASSSGKESSEKDTCETSQDSKSEQSDDPITKTVSSTSRSQSPVCNLSDFDRAKLVGPVTTAQSKLDTKVNVKSDSENSNDIDMADKKDQVTVKDSTDSSKDPNLLNKLIKLKTEDSGEAVPAVPSKTEKESFVKSGEVIDGESESSDRKRSAIEDTEDSKPKRSRLDFVIGKLGTQIGISPENIKCDEAMFDSDIDDSGKTSSESTENRSEEVTSEDDETQPRSSCKRLSEESLEHLIKQKIKEVLEQQKEMLTKQFEEKINELQASNELWKTKAKELHRRALELMNHQQRQDRRRAARESGQRRNVGIQVGEDRINSANQQTTSKGSTSPGRVLPLSSGASTNAMGLLSSKPTTVTTPNKPPSNQVLVQRMPMPNAVRPTQNNWKDQASTVKSILNNRIGQLSLSGVTQTTPAVAQSAQTSKAAVTKPTASQLPISSSIQTPAVQTLVKVIDLTSDEENNSAKGVTSVRSVAGQSLLNQAIYRPTTTTSIPSGARLIFSSAAGASFISNQTALTSAQPRQAGVQYQYLYAPTNQAVTTGNVVSLVSPPAGSGNTAARAAPAPPQLTRPTQPNASRPSQTNTSIRAPPPLQSAPTKLPPSTVAVKDKPETKAVSTDKSVSKTSNPLKHPAPLPAPPPTSQDTSNIEKALPPKPALKISRVSQGIVLSWNMITSSSHAEIASYQLFAYQETSAPISSNLWKKVGDVKALPLPMACTLTQFQEGNKYHFAVRAVDVHGRMSVFSDPSTIHLVVQNNK